MERLARFATEYQFVLDNRTIQITRRDNHGNLLPNKAWCVVHWRGAMNPHYLNRKGIWQYKNGTTFPTAEAAYAFLLEHGRPVDPDSESQYADRRCGLAERHADHWHSYGGKQAYCDGEGRVRADAVVYGDQGECGGYLDEPSAKQNVSAGGMWDPGM